MKDALVSNRTNTPKPWEPPLQQPHSYPRHKTLEYLYYHFMYSYFGKLEINRQSSGAGEVRADMKRKKCFTVVWAG